MAKNIDISAGHKVKMCRVESRRTYLIVRLQFNSSGFSEVNYIIAICRSKRVDVEETNGIKLKMEEK